MCSGRWGRNRGRRGWSLGLFAESGIGKFANRRKRRLAVASAADDFEAITFAGLQKGQAGEAAGGNRSPARRQVGNFARTGKSTDSLYERSRWTDVEPVRIFQGQYQFLSFSWRGGRWLFLRENFSSDFAFELLLFSREPAFRFPGDVIKGAACLGEHSRRDGAFHQRRRA